MLLPNLMRAGTINSSFLSRCVIKLGWKHFNCSFSNTKHEIDHSTTINKLYDENKHLTLIYKIKTNSSLKKLFIPCFMTHPLQWKNKAFPFFRSTISRRYETWQKMKFWFSFSFLFLLSYIQSSTRLVNLNKMFDKIPF